MRGGTLDYQAGYITATGDANFTGKVGDSRVVVGTSGIVYDRDCDYYDVARTNIAIKNDWGYTKVIGAKSAIQVVNDKIRISMVYLTSKEDISLLTCLLMSTMLIWNV